MLRLTTSSAISDSEFRALELQAYAIAQSEAMTGGNAAPVDIARANAVAKVLAACELGLPPVSTALNGMWIIERRLTLSARTMHALLLRSGLVGMMVQESSADRCCMTMWRTDSEYRLTEEMTLEQAEKQGLTRSRNGMKDNWKNYPGDMLWARVLSRLARRVAPDVIGGLYTPEDFGETESTARTAEVREAEAAPVSPRMGNQRADEFRKGFMARVLVNQLGLDAKAVQAECERIRNERFGGRLIADLTMEEAESLKVLLSEFAERQLGVEPQPEEALEGDFEPEPAQEPDDNLFPQGAMTPHGTWRTIATAKGIDADVQARLQAAARGHRHPEEVSAHEAAPPNDPDEMDMLIDVTVALLAGEIAALDLPLVREEGMAQRLALGGDANQ